MLKRTGGLAAIGAENVYRTAADAILAIDESRPDTVLIDDIGAIVARLRDLTGLAVRHHGQLDDIQRASITAAAERLRSMLDLDDA